MQLPENVLAQTCLEVGMSEFEALLTFSNRLDVYSKLDY